MATMDRIRAIESRLDSLATKQDLAGGLESLESRLRGEIRESEKRILEAIARQSSANY